jgi:hypothetical protein
MSLYRVWARYEPEFVNPLTGRVGQYRVIGTLRARWSTIRLRANRVTQEIAFLSSVKHQPGSIVRPHKEHVAALRKA